MSVNHPGRCEQGLTLGFTKVFQRFTDFYSYFLFMLGKTSSGWAL